MIHDPSPKFAGAGTLPLFSEARSNLRHNQHAPSCQPSGPGAGPSHSRPSAESMSKSRILTKYMSGQSSEIYDQGPG